MGKGERRKEGGAGRNTSIYYFCTSIAIGRMDEKANMLRKDKKISKIDEDAKKKRKLSKIRKVEYRERRGV